MVMQGYTATLVAATLAISRSSLYYRKRPRGSRADRTYDEQIVMACRETGVWLSAGDVVAAEEERAARESQACAASDARTRVAGALASSARTRKKEWGRVEAAGPNQIWQSDMTKIWAGPAVDWAYLVCVIDCCTREIVGWNLSHRCRTEDALAAVEQAVLERLPAGSREETFG
jgi:putative transposase